MSASTGIIAAIQAVGVRVTTSGPSVTQGAVLSLAGHPRTVKLYAWQVTDNGRATGTARPMDERRIQAIGSKTQMIHASPDPETVVLGWCDEFGPEPLIVAFNPYSVARRVNGKIERKVAAGIDDARASDSQQFRQGLLDEAYANEIAIGRNQHGEYVVAMKPTRFIDYLGQYKPIYHPNGEGGIVLPLMGRSMSELVADAELEEASPLDAVGADLPTVFDPALIEDGRERVAREIAIRRGQAVFRRQMLEAYGCCVMTGCTVEAALEAAHIVPYLGPSTNHTANGLILRADLHTLFDLGLIAVEPETLTILVSPKLDGTEYEVLRGQLLRLTDSGTSPSREALQVHRTFSGV